MLQISADNVPWETPKCFILSGGIRSSCSGFHLKKRISKLYSHFLFYNRNFMNDSLRTDVFVRYPPETIATACIYLSARKLKVPLPKNPSWFDVLNVEEDDIRDCCYRIVCLYNGKKVSLLKMSNKNS